MARQTINLPIYKDLDIGFGAHPITGAIKVLTNEEAVTEAIKNSIICNKFERLFNPTNCSDVPGQLFELITPTTITYLKTNIETTLKNFEPRVELLAVNVEDRSDQNELWVQVVYRLLNKIDPVVIDMFLERIR